jgi:hypothetical protein
MKCRQNWRLAAALQDQFGRNLITARAATGIESVNRIQALVRNVRTCRRDAKGATQVVVPRVSEYRCTARGRSNP